MSFFKKSPQTESCTDSGAENEGSCHSDQMSNDFSNDDGVDEGICLESNSAAERISKVGNEKVCLKNVLGLVGMELTSQQRVWCQILDLLLKLKTPVF